MSIFSQAETIIIVKSFVCQFGKLLTFAEENFFEWAQLTKYGKPVIIVSAWSESKYNKIFPWKKKVFKNKSLFMLLVKFYRNIHKVNCQLDKYYFHIKLFFKQNAGILTMCLKTKC